ncbi:putative chitinase [Microsporum canis]
MERVARNLNVTQVFIQAGEKIGDRIMQMRHIVRSMSAVVPTDFAARPKTSAVMTLLQNLVVGDHPRQNELLGWNLQRSCDTMEPEGIPIGGYTHINFAFLYINPITFLVEPMVKNQEALYDRVAALKKRKPGLKVWASIGGWDFNDPSPTFRTFSQLAASPFGQFLFSQSLLAFLEAHGFDGVDLDWEYPVASERGGSDVDYDNYVSWLANLRVALDGAGKGYGLSLTLPSSYWYLQHFDIAKMAKSVDWFNMMSYDLHGLWDQNNKWIGSIVNGHTNLTEISLAMDLLWRNSIKPDQVVMGLGFYGRSFTLKDPSCGTAGCPFSSAGRPGECTKSAGTLSFTEIEAILADPRRGAKKVYDPVAAVEIVTFDNDQWVSYDDSKSFKAKMDYANSHCIGGTLVWAVSLDSDGTATNALTGTTKPFIDDDGSNGGSGDVYIGPDLWENSTHVVACEPPCTMVLPPFPIETPVTVNWPAYTTSVLSSSAGTTYTKTTVINIPPFVVTEIPVWPVTVAEPGLSALFPPKQSIAPPPLILTLPATEAVFPVTHPEHTKTITTPSMPDPTTSGSATISTPAAVQPGMVSGCREFYKAMAGDNCYGIATSHGTTLEKFIEWNPAVGADCSGLWANEYYCISVGSDSTITGGSTSGTASSTRIPPVFHTTAHTITIQPQPTFTSIQPPTRTIPPLQYVDGKPPSSGGCTGGKPLSGCGVHDCTLFGCGNKCGLLGCDGGCGLGFCGGGCGLGGCGPGCGDGKCIGPGGDGDDSGDDDTTTTTTTSCTSSMTTTTACDTACSDSEDKACETICDTVTVGGCQKDEPLWLQIETPVADPWPWLDESDEEMLSKALSVASFINPRLTAIDPITIDGTPFTAGPAPTTTSTPVHTETSNCKVCTSTEGQKTSSCTFQDNCTPTPPPKPELSATCDFRSNYGVAYRFTVWNIRGWANDHGMALKREEDGCATLSGWVFKEATAEKGASASFNLDYFIKAGCVERAIVSAGGPKVECIEIVDFNAANHPDKPLQSPNATNTTTTRIRALRGRGSAIV